MKIGIPTNDGLTLSPDFGEAKGFLILTIELGEIVKEEMRWNKLSIILCSPEGYLHHIHDCQAVMLMNIGDTYKDILTGRQKEIIRTREPIITNAWFHYLGSILHKEANTLCCP